MMEHSELNNQALINIKDSNIFNEFSISNDDFKKLSGWTIIAMFLVESRNSLLLIEKSKKINDFTHIEEITFSNGLFKNSILSYCKCFSSSGKGQISLDAKNIYANRNDLLEIHQNMMEIRNKYIAHNDNENGFDIAISYTSENNNEIIFSQTYTFVIPYENFKKFTETIQYCEEQLIIRFNKKIDKLEKEIGKKIIFK
ncbi:hypothetical protein [Chryseobacterium sp. VD8]|uniref:hypothetical protein n=1 Tax=Chryseobacterium sp. VD8 TaxID=3081254 RepID=UPI003015B19F